MKCLTKNPFTSPPRCDRLKKNFYTHLNSCIEIMKEECLVLNILLVCSAGMSTTMLVKRMKESAEKNKVDANIWSVGDANSPESIKKADIILLGPQVRFLENKIRELVENKVPVSLIDMRIYGSMDGDAALKTALDSLEKFNK